MSFAYRLNFASKRGSQIVFHAAFPLSFLKSCFAVICSRGFQNGFNFMMAAVIPVRRRSINGSPGNLRILAGVSKGY